MKSEETREREGKGEKGRDERREREGRFQYAGAYLSIHFRGQRLRDEEPLHPPRLSRPSWFHGTVSQQADAVHHDPSIHRSITQVCSSQVVLEGEFRFRFSFFSFFFSKMGTIHHRRAERNLLLILRDRLVRSEEKLVFRGISRHCLVDNGMNRGGWRRFEKVVRDSGSWRRYLEIFPLVFENLILNRTNGVEPIRNNSLNA